MQYIKSHLENVNLKLVIGTTVAAGLIAIAVIKYKHFKEYTQPSVQQKSELLSQISIDTIQPQVCSQKDFVRVINSMKKFVPKTEKLNIEAIKIIYIAQHELSRSSFESIVKRNRIARRNMMSDLHAYKQKVIELQYQIEDLHNNHLNAVLAHFKIEKRKWYETVEEVAQKESEKWQLMILQTEEAELDALRNKDKLPISMAEMVKMCVYKTQVVEELVEEMKKLCSNSDRNQVFSILDRRMSDLLYLKFNAEEEDINYSLTKLSTDQHRILEGLQQKVNQVLKKLIEELDIA